MSSKQKLYERVKDLALQKRREYGVLSQSFGLREVRNIYKNEGISIFTSRAKLRNLRAAYMNDGDGCDVILNGKLPREARLFSLLHELKHHYLDSDKLGEMVCLREYNEQPEIEISAEIFAAEFIWPDYEFSEMITDFGITSKNFSPELLISFKRQAGVNVSYSFLKKRVQFHRLATPDQLQHIQFQKLEEEIYGKPYWKKKYLK